jgi:hypothetical protein
MAIISTFTSIFFLCRSDFGLKIFLQIGYESVTMTDCAVSQAIESIMKANQTRTKLCGFQETQRYGRGIELSSKRPRRRKYLFICFETQIPCVSQTTRGQIILLNVVWGKIEQLPRKCGKYQQLCNTRSDPTPT